MIKQEHLLPYSLMQLAPGYPLHKIIEKAPSRTYLDGAFLSLLSKKADHSGATVKKSQIREHHTR
jgi:hypothetical protein